MGEDFQIDFSKYDPKIRRSYMRQRLDLINQVLELNLIGQISQAQNEPWRLTFLEEELKKLNQERYELMQELAKPKSDPGVSSPPEAKIASSDDLIAK